MANEDDNSNLMGQKLYLISVWINEHGPFSFAPPNILGHYKNRAYHRYFHILLNVIPNLKLNSGKTIEQTFVTSEWKRMPQLEFYSNSVWPISPKKMCIKFNVKGFNMFNCQTVYKQCERTFSFTFSRLISWNVINILFAEGNSSKQVF